MIVSNILRGSSVLSHSKVSFLRNIILSIKCKKYITHIRLVAIMKSARTRSLANLAHKSSNESGYVKNKWLLGGASTIGGIGGVCLWGLQISKRNEESDRKGLWPQYIRDRVKSTYMYFGMGIAVAAASALALSRYPSLLKRLAPESKMGTRLCTAAIVIPWFVTLIVPYSEGIGPKQMAWIGQHALMGVVLAPACFISGPLAIRTAWYTAGATGGLSCVAMCTPCDDFLYVGGAFAMVLGTLSAISIGNIFLTHSAISPISLYGGLLIIGTYLLYDIRMVIDRAESHPKDADQYPMDAEEYPTNDEQNTEMHDINLVVDERSFDPINSAIGIYTDYIIMFFNALLFILDKITDGKGGRGVGGVGGMVGGVSSKDESQKTNKNGKIHRSRKLRRKLKIGHKKKKENV